MNTSLIVMARPPVRGKVKTRLAAHIGEDRALSIYTRLLAHTITSAASWSGSKFLYWTDREGPLPLDASWTVRWQEGSDLGERMAHAFDAAMGDAGAVMVGTDCPGLTPAVLQQAAAALGRADAVLVPAFDGGYCLIGMKVLLPEVFTGIPWSTDQVFERTVLALRKNHRSFVTLPMLRDVDEWEDVLATGFPEK